MFRQRDPIRISSGDPLALKWSGGGRYAGSTSLERLQSYRVQLDEMRSNEVFRLNLCLSFILYALCYLLLLVI